MDRVTELAISLKGSVAHLQELVAMTAGLRSAARARYWHDGSDTEDVSVIWERAQTFDARRGIPFSSWLWDWYRSQGTKEKRQRKVAERWQASVVYESTSMAYHENPEWLLIRAHDMNLANCLVIRLLETASPTARHLVQRVILDRDMDIREAAEAIDMPLADAAELLRITLGEMRMRRQ